MSDETRTSVKTLPKSSATTWASAAALALALGMGMSTGSLADEAEARSLFKAMSDYMAAQTAISFDYDSTLEVVTAEGQKLGLASSGAVTLARPDKLRATRTGGFADVEMVFDGTTLSLLGKNVNAYAQVEMPRAPSTSSSTRSATRITGRFPPPTFSSPTSTTR